jgi:transposase
MWEKTWGRKRHVLVDTQGNLLAIKVTGAHRSDQQGARGMLKPLKESFPKIKLLWGDSHYGGTFIGWLRWNVGWTMREPYAPSPYPNAAYSFPRGPRSIGMPSFRQAFDRCPRDGSSSEPSPGSRAGVTSVAIIRDFPAVARH